VVNGHKSAAHTDSPDDGTGKTCLGGGMHLPRLPVLLVMAALCNRAGHYIFALWLLSFFFLLLYGRPMEEGRPLYFLPCGFFLLSFFFPRLISAAADWMSTILRHMMWP